MQTFNIIKELPENDSYRVKGVMGIFDLHTSKTKEHFFGELDLDFNWNIGAIVGRSGTGKSTIAKQLFVDNYFLGFNYKEKSVLDDMPENIDLKTIIKIFNSVGFSSPPSWLKPYEVLSTGEKMRVDLARCLLSDKETIVFDEFTSVIDRDIARIGSYAISKSIKKNNKKFIAVTCHYDIIDWLECDWIFNTNTMQFIKKK